VIGREGACLEGVGEESKGDSGEPGSEWFSVSAILSGIISLSLPFHLFGDGHFVKGSLDSGQSPIATDRQGDDSEGILVPEVDCKLLSIAPSDEDGVASS
jgi:hypothetical protein